MYLQNCQHCKYPLWNTAFIILDVKKGDETKRIASMAIVSTLVNPTFVLLVFMVFQNTKVCVFKFCLEFSNVDIFFEWLKFQKGKLSKPMKSFLPWRINHCIKFEEMNRETKSRGTNCINVSKPMCFATVAPLSLGHHNELQILG